MNYIVAMLAVLVAAFANGTAADSLEELEAQIREHQSALDSLQSRLISIVRAKKIRELAERQEEMEKFLGSVFHVDSLTLGEAELSSGCCESYGVYVSGRHLDDVHSDRHEFTKYELADSVYTVLLDARLIDSSFSFVTPSISPQADSMLRSWGGGVNGIELNYGDPDEVLVMDANSKSARITSSDDVVMIDVANHDGSRTIATVIRGNLIGLVEIPQP